MRWKRIVIALGVVVLLLVGWTGREVYRSGYFKTIEPHFVGTCRLIEGPVGAEDITIHPKKGIAYVSAEDRRAVLEDRAVPGKLFSYDLSDGSLVDLTPDADISFQPHGISLWVGENGIDTLFVVNHPVEDTGVQRHTIEIFDIVAGKLVHRASLADPLLVMPNDLVAVGIDEFYVTSTHAYPPGKRQTIETYLGLRGAKVLYYGMGGFRPVLEDLVFPNGINVSKDGRLVYVAGVTSRTLWVYDRDPATRALTLREEVFLGTGPDNIEVDAQGDLWIGAHPQLMKVATLEGDPSAIAPAQIVRVSQSSVGGYDVEEVYLGAGKELSAATVGAVHGKRLLIGSAYGNGFLDCTMD